MPPRKAPKTRPPSVSKTAKGSKSSQSDTTDSTADISRVISEQLASTLPDMFSKFGETLMRTLKNSGTGTDSGQGDRPEVVVTDSGLGDGPEIVVTGSGKAGPEIVASGSDGTGIGGQAVIVDRGCTFKTFLGCKPHEFSGIDDAIATLHWMEKIEYVFEVCKCTEGDKVTFATHLFTGRALTWWNAIVRTRGRAEISVMTWGVLKSIMIKQYVPEHEVQRLESELWNLTMQGSDIAGYTNRFYELIELVPRMVPLECQKIGRYLYGLPQSIRDNVMSSLPGTLASAVELAHSLTESKVRGGVLPKIEVRRDSGYKRSRDSRGNGSKKRSRNDDRRPQPIQSYAAVTPVVDGQGRRSRCDKCGGTHGRTVPCWFCELCKKKGHTARFCRNVVGACFHCGDPNHRQSRCPKLNSISTNLLSGSDADTASGRVFTLGAKEAREDPSVVTGD